MNEKQLRTKVASIMIGWIGCKESDGSHQKILDIYNSYSPLPRGVKMLSTYAWCAATVSAAFIKAGLTDIGFVECSCSKMIDLYKAKGRFKEADNYVPSVGDLIMYDWDDSGRGDNTGAPEHVGMVTSVSGDTIRVIEGNKNDAVDYRTMKVNGRYIRGYCLPDYASKATTTSSSTSTKKSTTKLNKTVQWSGYVATKSSPLNIRTWAGVGYPQCSFSPLKKNTTVGVCDSVKDSKGVTWYYIKYGSKYGFASSEYIKKR